MNNIGNSCYLNSVVQTLNSLDEFNELYYNAGKDHMLECKRIPAQCFYYQIAKVAIGLCSGKYA